MTGYKNNYIIKVIIKHRNGYYGNKNLDKGWKDFDSNTRLWTRGRNRRAEKFFLANLKKQKKIV